MVVSPIHYHQKYDRKWFVRFLFTCLALLNATIVCGSFFLYVTVDFHQIPDGKGYLYHLIVCVSLNLITIIIALIYWLFRYRQNSEYYINHNITDPNLVMRNTSPYDQHRGFISPPDSSSTTSSSTGDEDTLCVICHRHFDPEKGEVIVTECCQQLLHADCQVQWLSKKDLCPFPYCDRTVIN